MKKLLLIALLIPIFFPLVADASQAVHGDNVKLIPIDAIGPAIAIGAVGTYYATKDNPEVGRLKDNAQSVYQKSNYAKKIATGALSSAYQDFYSSDAGGVYAGVPAYVGAKLADVVDYVKKQSGTAYSYWKGVIDDFGGATEPTLDSHPYNSHIGYKGDVYYVTGYSHYNSVDLDDGPLTYPSSSTLLGVKDGFRYYAVESSNLTDGSIYIYRYYPPSQPGNIVKIYRGVAGKSTGVPIGVVNPALDLDNLADNIDTSNNDFKNEIRDILANLPKSQVQVSDATSAQGINSSAPPAISSADLQKITKGIAQDVTNQLAEDIQNIADANPNSLDAQIEAEKAKAEAERQALEDQKEELDTPATIGAVEWGTIDFAPLLMLKNSFNSHAPFSWLSDIGTSWNALTATPIAPSMHIDLGMTEFNLSLSRFDNVAGLIRSVMSMILVFGTTWLIIKRFGDM